MTLLTKETDQGTLALCQGAATLAQAQDVREAFTSLFIAPPSLLRVDLSGITEGDITFLQILVSFFKEAQRRGILLRLEHLPAEHFLQDLFDLAGLDPRVDLLSEEGNP